MTAPHHDGSELYVDAGSPALGDAVTVRVRVPSGAPDTRVHVRYVVDGEPFWRELTPAGTSAAQRWYAGEVLVGNPVTNYRFLLDDAAGTRWLTGTGVHVHDVRDTGDFVLTTHEPGPEWMTQAVGYQIFPDRFAMRGESPADPDWGWGVEWSAEPAGVGRAMAREFYGGNLGGITDHLDHLAALGVTFAYLTPFFPAPSNHRYNASSFDVVDPLLGGDAALAELTAAAHARGICVLGDFTTNHTGVTHDWFTTGRESDEYYWTDDELGYSAWLGVPSLPKLNYAGQGLADRLWGSEGAALLRWLRPPYNLDGWRIDVANMTGRHGADDHNHDVARAIRTALRSANPQAALVGEHFHDAVSDLPGDGWQAVMNYAAFTKPAWHWLVRPDYTGAFVGFTRDVRVRPWPGEIVVRSMREFAAGLPWSTLTRQWNLLDSHDTARIRTVTGSADLVRVALALQMTYLGTPVLFAGSEIGLEGINGENARRTMPWDDAGSWDGDTLKAAQDLIALRRANRALQVGGLRWLHVSDDALVFERATSEDTLVVALARAPWDGRDLPGLRGENLFGGASLDGRISGDGPAAQVWRVG